MDPSTEIRRLRPAELYTLARILTVSDSWKMLMGVVPKEGTENEPKFITEHFALIEQASCQQRKPAAEIFLEEWSTMGKRRPTLQSTLDLLVRVQLFRAADYIAVDLLKRQPPERPASGPAAPIDISDEEIAKLILSGNSDLEIVDSQTLESKDSLESVLDGVSYPSQLSDQSYLIEHREREVEGQDNDQRGIGLEWVGEISTLRIHSDDINELNSNLMQFSKNDVEPLEKNNENPTPYSNSNLIQFSRNSIRDQSAMVSGENFPQVNGVCNPHLSDNFKAVLQKGNITCATSSNNEEEYNSEEIVREGNYLAEKNGLKVQNTGANGSVPSSDNYKKFELQSSELPACVAEIGRGSMPIYSEVRSSELPQFVVDIARRGSTPDEESVREPTLSNLSTSSDASSDFLTNITSSSEKNTENNIPVCVNFPSGSSANEELISAELPQFVADLGHRRDDHSSAKTSNGASVLTSQFSNDQFEYVYLNSQELPLVVSECNKMRSRVDDSPIELQSTELPQCIAELQIVIQK